MSSSAETPTPPIPARHLPYGWDAFSERSAPVETELGSPATELATVLQLYRSALSAERGSARKAIDEALTVTVDQAVLVDRLGAALDRHHAALEQAGLARVHRELRILREQMVDGLSRGGVTTEDPTGQPLEVVADRVEVIGWRHGTEFAAEVVAETHEPIVLHNDAVIRPGRVTMGAPPPAEEGQTGNANDMDREQE